MRRLLILVLALGLVRSALGDPPTVSTDREGARVLPLPSEEGVFHFAIFGDRTTGPPSGLDVLREAVRDANLLGPDLVMTVGDHVNGYNRRPDWMRQMRAYREVMDGLEMPWFPVPGNHDVYWGGGKPPPGHHESDFEEHFGPLWYWFGHKDAAFVVLYSDEGDRERNRKGWGDASVNRMSDEQIAWLRKTLGETRAYDHVFVFLHHPRWITEAYPGTNWDDVHALFVEAKNVTAVFAGHIHRRRYDGVRDGIEYFTLATTGGALPYEAAGTGYLHHMNVVTVRKRGITVATIPVGAVLDPREMTPARHAEVDRLRAMRPVFESPPLALGPDGTSEGVLRLRLANPTTRPVELTLSLETSDRGWFYAPSHRHVDLGPRAESVLELRYARDAKDDLAGLDLPRLSLQADYLAPTCRVSLPAVELPVPWRLGPLPPAAPATDRGRALRVTGDACLEVPVSVLDVPDGPFTVEGWLDADDYAGRRAFLAKTENAEYGLFVSDGRPTFSVWLGSAYVTAAVSEPVLQTGRWHHLAGVFDGREVRLYVDGRLLASKAGTGARRRNPWPLFVGADPDRHGRPCSGIEGLVDEVRVSSVARYAGPSFEPSRRFEPDGDTLLLLHLDGALGPIAPDHGPGGRHVLRRGAVGYVAVETPAD